MSLLIPDFSVVLTFAFASFVLAVTPGPDMAFFIARTINFGRAHGLAAVSGAVTGIVAHVALAAFGISLLLSTVPAAFLALKISGAGYLLWLSVQTFCQGGGWSFSAEGRNRGTPRPSLRDSYLIGLGINLSNPKIVLFFVTFLPQFVSQADPDAAAKLLFLGGEFLMVSIPIVVVIVLGAEMVRDVLTRSKKVQKALNWSFAAVFAGFALAIIAVEGRR